MQMQCRCSADGLEILVEIGGPYQVGTVDVTIGAIIRDHSSIPWGTYGTLQCRKPLPVECLCILQRVGSGRDDRDRGRDDRGRDGALLSLGSAAWPEILPGVANNH